MQTNSPPGKFTFIDSPRPNIQRAAQIAKDQAERGIRSSQMREEAMKLRRHAAFLAARVETETSTPDEAKKMGAQSTGLWRQAYLFELASFISDPFLQEELGSKSSPEQLMELAGELRVAAGHISASVLQFSSWGGSAHPWTFIGISQLSQSTRMVARADLYIECALQLESGRT
jgi:hypothetical protein